MKMPKLFKNHKLPWKVEKADGDSVIVSDAKGRHIIYEGYDLRYEQWVDLIKYMNAFADKLEV